MVNTELGDWRATWRLFERYKGILYRTAVQVTQSLPSVAHDEAVELVHSFILDRLPKVVEMCKTHVPKDMPAYLRAAMRNYIYDCHRARSRQIRALKTLALESHPTEPPIHVDSSMVAQATDGLPEHTVRAVDLFLGTDRRPHSIREVAEELGISRHKARLAVLDGLIAVVLRLAKGGLLSTRQAAASRLVLLEGKSYEEAGEALGLAPTQVRGAIQAARSHVSAALER